MTTKIRNLTPHAIHLYGVDDKLIESIEPEEVPARVEVTQVLTATTIQGLPVVNNPCLKAEACN